MLLGRFSQGRFQHGYRLEVTDPVLQSKGHEYKKIPQKSIAAY
jgi:hypothetical protein